jgi:1,4-alpha-glucan branching enzyme
VFRLDCSHNSKTGRFPIRPSERGGTGAVVYPDGTTFRVWTLLQMRSLAGDFNEWAADSTPPASEAHCYWSAHVPRAGSGTEYKYSRSGPANTTSGPSRPSS